MNGLTFDEKRSAKVGARPGLQGLMLLQKTTHRNIVGFDSSALEETEESSSRMVSTLFCPLFAEVFTMLNKGFVLVKGPEPEDASAAVPSGCSAF